MLALVKDNYIQVICDSVTPSGSLVTTEIHLFSNHANVIKFILVTVKFKVCVIKSH